MEATGSEPMKTLAAEEKRIVVILWDDKKIKAERDTR